MGGNDQFNARVWFPKILHILWMSHVTLAEDIEIGDHDEDDSGPEL